MSSKFADITFVKKLFKQCCKNGKFDLVEKWFGENFINPELIVSIVDKNHDHNTKGNIQSIINVSKIFIKLG